MGCSTVITTSITVTTSITHSDTGWNKIPPKKEPKMMFFGPNFLPWGAEMGKNG